MTSILFATLDHIDELIQLNSKYLIGHLTDTQKQSGFVRIEYHRDDLQQIIANKEIVIATNGEKIMGYYLIGRKSGKAALNYQRNKALTLFDTNRISFENIGYGCQVCIDEEFRNNGLFKQMLNTLTEQVKDEYSHLLCSVSNDNIVSLKKHIGNGWKVFDNFETTQFLIYTTTL